MKLKALRTFRGDHGTFRRGDELDVRTAYAKQLIDRGLAEKVVSKAKAKGNPPAQGAAAPNQGE